MNVGRLVGGIICLAVAALLGMLNTVLPAEDMMFTVGGENMPWVPVVILGIVGIVLLASAWGWKREATKERREIVVDPEKVEPPMTIIRSGNFCFRCLIKYRLDVSWHRETEKPASR